MTALSRGKQMLKAGLDKQGLLKIKRISPDAEAKFYCRSGIDKDCFEVKYISDYKGYGVFATKHIKRDDFLLQYVGEKIDLHEAKERERKGAENKMFFYLRDGKQHCIDAEATEGHICQLVNDASQGEANSHMKLKIFDGVEKLCLYAKEDIQPNEEILYDYGDEKNLWWRKKFDLLCCGGAHVVKSSPPIIYTGAIQDFAYTLQTCLKCA